jgi:transcriptional regulator with XRE-family HTH domain
MTRDPRKPFTLDEIKAKMSPVQLSRIRARSAELAAEEMSLAQLRKARAMTQTALARKLGKTQALVSRIESSGDLYISTMRKQIEALGGGLDIRAIFPDMASVSITGFKELAQLSPLDASATKQKKLKATKFSVKRPKVRSAVGHSPARSKQALRLAAK